jgi:hypothetical protein
MSDLDWLTYVVIALSVAGGVLSTTATLLVELVTGKERRRALGAAASIEMGARTRSSMDAQGRITRDASTLAPIESMLRYIAIRAYLSDEQVRQRLLEALETIEPPPEDRGQAVPVAQQR